MQYVDSVYGSTSFTEPLILDLMHSDTMRRLRSVASRLAADPIYFSKCVRSFSFSQTYSIRSLSGIKSDGAFTVKGRV